jgi:hypothetical protein
MSDEKVEMSDEKVEKVQEKAKTVGDTARFILANKSAFKALADLNKKRDELYRKVDDLSYQMSYIARKIIDDTAYIPSDVWAVVQAYTDQLQVEANLEAERRRAAMIQKRE